jgi:hypothetical protein
VAEESLLVANLGRLPAAERARQLALLGASSLTVLRARLRPAIRTSCSATACVVRITRQSLDGRNHLALELRLDPRKAIAAVIGAAVTVRARSGGVVHLRLRIATDAAPLTPLARGQIFNHDFLAFLEHARAGQDSALSAARSSRGVIDSTPIVRYRRLEREVRSVELLASEEKLMAGLPNFATYFGRDMLMAALMMRPIWSGVMSERVIASVLERLGPDGDVSHEEALGEQAIREAANDYNVLATEYFRVARTGRRVLADSILGRARGLLRDLQLIRQNYHMIDDEFQLPVLVARYLADSSVSAARKRTFLQQRAGTGASHLALLLREMALVAEKALPYTRDSAAIHLVGFVRRDSSHWRSASWRDSDAGYGNGRFAMDINAIWVPEALASIATIATALPAIGVSRQALDSIAPEILGTPLGRYLADPTSLKGAIETWRGARRHFLVTLGPREIQERIAAKLAWLPPAERQYWGETLAQPVVARDSLTFLALSLDAVGRPIPIVNTDPATELFLRNLTAGILEGETTPDAVRRELEAFVRPYPVGLFVDGLGPVVANDAYASQQVWEVFRRDPYHSPRVVWGREVNLLLLGLARQITAGFDASGRLRDLSLGPYVEMLRDALERTRAAVTASGLEHSELWSYQIEGGRLQPIRYGGGSDLQLWSSTDLAVQFMLSRLPQP